MASAVDLTAVAWEVHFQGAPLISNISTVAEQYREDGQPVEDLVRRSEVAALISSLVAENERLIRDNIVAPAECGAEGCDDPDCPYSHKPLTLRQAYDNAVSRLRDAEDSSRRHHRAMASSDEARIQAERLLAEAREALQPFADFAEYLEVETEGFSDTDELDLCVEESGFRLERFKIGAFRKARATLSTGGVNG